ncbi:MAG: hypothetical protein ACLQQB_02490 [Solirubrobacteraceae bacterium]
MDRTARREPMHAPPRSPRTPDPVARDPLAGDALACRPVARDSPTRDSIADGSPAPHQRAGHALSDNSLAPAQRRRRITLGWVELIALVALIAALAPSVQSDGGPWSQPATLDTCSAAGRPEILFPSDAPRHGTGAGAIVWSSGFHCQGGAGPRVSAIAPGADLPGTATIPRTPAGRTLALSAPTAAAAASHGQILLAGPRTGVSGDGDLLLSEGLAGGPFTPPLATDGPASPLALTTAYLGDVALVSPSSPSGSTGAIELRIHRYYMHSFLAPVSVTTSHAVEGLTLAMDYRSDALAVWERSGAIYARDMPASGRTARSAQRVATAAPGARIAALLSDDDRAILAWSETRRGITRVFAELSAPGVSFGTPRLLERYADPGGLTPPPPRLVRLISESVMLAWTGVESGHWVVRTAAIDLNGVRAIDTISSSGRNALLTDLIPGPAGEAYALWSEPQSTSSGGLDLHDRALYAARGIDAYPGRTIFGAPEQIVAAGASGASGEATIGVDPDSDRAITAWRTSGGTIDYSLRSVGAG